LILFFGDLHGKFGHVERAVVEHRPTAIVLLGDIEAPKPLDEVLAKVLDKTEIWYIHGNHDTDKPELIANLNESKLAHRNLHGRVVEIAGVRVAGLGGIFREEIWWPKPVDVAPSYESYADYQNRTVYPAHGRSADMQLATLKAESKLLKHRSTIFSQEYYALAAMGADILVTHEAPSCHRYGFRAIDELARSLGVKKTFHGHNHDSLDYQAKWDELGFSAYGVGLRGITDMQGAVLRPGELDKQRSVRQNKL
jgi:predicted phosphodiesterase